MEKYWPPNRFRICRRLGLVSEQLNTTKTKKTNSLKSNAEKVGLCINTSKTKIQKNENCHNNTTLIIADEGLQEEVQRFQYLDSCQTSDGNIEVDLKSRIRKTLHHLNNYNQYRHLKVSTSKQSNVCLCPSLCKRYIEKYFYKCRNQPPKLFDF